MGRAVCPLHQDLLANSLKGIKGISLPPHLRLQDRAHTARQLASQVVRTSLVVHHAHHPADSSHPTDLHAHQAVSVEALLHQVLPVPTVLRLVRREVHLHPKATRDLLPDLPAGLDKGLHPGSLLHLPHRRLAPRLPPNRQDLPRQSTVSTQFFERLTDS